MFNQTTLFNVMAVLTWCLQVVILVRMSNKGLAREFRTFFAYTAFTLCLSVLRFWIRVHYGFYSVQYFVTYWPGFAIQVTLLFFVIQEIYAKVLYRYEGLRTLASIVFRWAFMLLVVIAIISATASPAADSDWMYSGILKLDYSARIVEFGLIALLFVFARTLALGWRECVFGIAVGTCFYCSTELAGIAVRAHYADQVASLYPTLQSVWGIIPLAIWTVYFYRAEQRVPGARLRNPYLEEWNRAVVQFLKR